MASTFSEILERDFRWPTKGDKLFKPSQHSLDNAIIESDPHSRLIIMTDGYWRAANSLVDKAKVESFERDFLVYPIIFCYRHYLELELKTMLALYGGAVGLESNWHSHDLVELWSQIER